MHAFRKAGKSKASSRELLADSLRLADRADREAIARMSIADRLTLTLDISEFAVRNAGIAKKP